MANKELTDAAILMRIAAVLITVFVFVSLLPVIAYHCFPTIKAAREINERIGVLGTYGDMFGMLNSVFSGCALTGAIYAVILQRRELSEQQKRMDKADKERDEERKEQTKQKQIDLIKENKNAMLNMICYLAQVYTNKYNANPSQCDSDYMTAERVRDGILTPQNNPKITEDSNKDPGTTTKGKMLHYTNLIEEWTIFHEQAYHDFMGKMLVPFLSPEIVTEAMMQQGKEPGGDQD